MTQPLIVEYLKTHSFQQLEDEHGVCARFSSDGSKCSLNYDQILVKNGDPFAEQCRGMVIRPLQFKIHIFGDNWKNAIVGDVKVIAWPMNRFYNHGDISAAQVNWSDPDLRVYEKLDGTMIVMYWDEHQNKWHAATRAVPEADLPIRKDHLEIGDMTFSELFWKALASATNSPEFCFANKDLTYVFELTSPFNRIVVKYDKPQATLLAIKHTSSGNELNIDDHPLANVVPTPKTWALHSAAALDAFVNSADPSQLEGAVVCDSLFNRLKVKNKTWVLSSRAKDLVTVSRRSAIEAIIQNKIDDVIPLVEKDIADELLRMQNNLRSYLKQVNANFCEWKERAAGDRKTFAQIVSSSGDWATPYFQLLDGKAPDALSWAVAMSEAGKLPARSLDVLLEKIDGCQGGAIDDAL